MLEFMSHPAPADQPAPAAAEHPSVLRWPADHGAQGELVESAPAPSMRDLSAADFQNPRGRRVVLPALLFLATCASTFLAGALNWNPFAYFETEQAGHWTALDWTQGLIYMAAVIGILLTHEMGHFLQTVRYGVPASFPFFIPLPVVMTGTMGAVIGMEGSRANRKQLFDIGISGPWAGLIVALPIIWFGILQAEPLKAGAESILGDPLVFKILTRVLRPELPPGTVLDKNHPLLMAGWVGMLITGLNMLPISQLDGGHVIYGLFGPSSRVVARGFLMAAILFVVVGDHYNWIVMLVLVILLGVDHPPTRDDSVKLGFFRNVFGFVSLAIPVFCFTPVLL